ncbi:MAG TPA: hypothetical protein VK348_06290, partial [Planctomycetota bacterium]|nr:hypothetical protein [Planctomycetota bacterium]
EEFLLDAFSRMNNFVLQILNSRRGPVAEQQIETHMQNLIGPMLDEFRNAGTAILNDKHVGQDPFATDPAELVKELQPAAQDDQAVVMPLPSLADNPPVNFTSHTVDVESHPLAMKIRDDQADAEAADDEPAPELPPSPPPVQRATAATARPDAGNAGNSQAERFKEALRNLVRQGMMTKDEARAAWQTKRQTFGPK